MCDRLAEIRKLGAELLAVDPHELWASRALLKETGAGDAIANYHWEFNLIQDDKTVNAWVMPGGKAAVYTGILPYTRDETGLAVVLGHEVAHALAGHGNERLS